MNTPDREPDSSFDGPLAGALKTRAASAPSDACLDAETLAAWADDALSAGERSAVEAHAADCARCQAMMASMVKTAPSIAVATWWRLPAFSWLIPAAAVAVAIVVWVIVPGPGPAQPRDRLVPSSATPTATADATAPTSTAQTAAPPEPDARSLSRQAPPNETAELKAQPSTPAVAKQKEATALDKTASANEARADAAASSTTRAAAPQAAAAGASTSPPPPPALSERSFAARVGAPETVIVSTNPSSRWRIVPGGNVQRSADGGSTWQLQQTGATVTLTAGASPSPSVCWLVGPGGTVLLSTDDRAWRRIAFPEATPLISVSATDERTATVTAADGRRFSTTDGGGTWVPSGAI